MADCIKRFETVVQLGQRLVRNDYWRVASTFTHINLLVFILLDLLLIPEAAGAATDPKTHFIILNH